MIVRGMISATVLAALIAAPAFAQAPRLLAQAGSWSKVSAAGVMAYLARDGAGGSIEIGCDFARTLDGSATGIALESGGRLLPPDSIVVFRVGGESITMPTGKSGGVSLATCPSCKEGFSRLWSLMRAGEQLEVIASDGRRAVFPLDGAAELMPAAPCGEP